MPVEITIPRLGWSMDEGNFLGWLKKDGDTIKTGDPIFTLESEKSAQDIEATDPGILRIAKDSPQSGDVVKVGQVIGHLLAEGDLGGSALHSGNGGADTTKAQAPAADHQKPLVSVSKAGSIDAPSPSDSSEAQAISPRARRVAAELGVDTRGLKGSGTSRRITEADVLKNVNAKAPAAAQTSSMRRLIAQRTTTSFATIPHFYLRVEVDATALVRLREDLLPEIESTTGSRVTLSDFLLRAQALALKDLPAANCIWAGDALVPLSSCDVGLVVGLPEGLMIPVVRSGNEGNLAAVTKQRAALVAAAKAGKLTQDQMQGGATSLSNLGNSPVDEFAAVISPGQSSMLAIGRAIPRPYGFGGKLALRTTLKLCLSVDHRVLDGGPAAEFLGRIAGLLEAPDQLV